MKLLRNTGVTNMFNRRLNDLHLILLSTAAGRDDGSILPYSSCAQADPERANKAVEQLLKKGLIEEQSGAIRADMWREDGEQAFRVVINDAGRAAINVGEPDAQGAPEPARSPEPAAPRSTKRQQLIDLLSRDGGASLDEMVAALGWLPHTARAAMTGLKKAGMQVDSEKLDGVRRYRLTAAA